MKRINSSFWLESMERNARLRAQAARRRRRWSIALFFVLAAVAYFVGRNFYNTFFPL